MSLNTIPFYFARVLSFQFTAQDQADMVAFLKTACTMIAALDRAIEPFEGAVDVTQTKMDLR